MYKTAARATTTPSAVTISATTTTIVTTAAMATVTQSVSCLSGLEEGVVEVGGVPVVGSNVEVVPLSVSGEEENMCGVCVCVVCVSCVLMCTSTHHWECQMKSLNSV